MQILPRTGFILVILLVFALSAFAQKKKTIEIVNADVLRYEEAGGDKLRKLIGNVALRQDDVTLYCDSALFYTKDNKVDAFGNVKIIQGDSLSITSNILHYFGNRRLAIATGNVFMNHVRLDLATEVLEYNMDTKRARYEQGGTVTSGEIILTSNIGYYYSETKDAWFRGKVFLDDPEYDLFSDTLRYNAGTEIAWFYGPTDIIQESTKIYCETGWYNTKTDIGSFGPGTIMYDPPQTLYADSLYFENATGYGRALRRFEWIDTAKDIILTGRKADFYRDGQRLIATDSILLTTVMDEDSLFLTSDTFRTYVQKIPTDTIVVSDSAASDVRFFHAYRNVRIFKSDMQAVCDSMMFSYADSTFRLFVEPVLWNEANQLKGDTITIVLKNEKIEQVGLHTNALVVNEAHRMIYNQLKGDSINGYFLNDVLDNMIAEGNCESIYFAEGEAGAYLGVNQAKSARVTLLFSEKKVSRIKFYERPDAVFTPMQMKSPTEYRLSNFGWHAERRPLSKEDLFR